MPKYNPGDIIQSTYRNEPLIFKVISINGNQYRLEYQNACRHCGMLQQPGETWEPPFRVIDHYEHYKLVKAKVIKDPRPTWW